MSERAKFRLIASLMTLPLLVAGCDREAEHKEAEFKIVADSLASQTDELCAAAKAAQSAWLAQGNSERWSHWRAEADRYCGLAAKGMIFAPRGD